ncbi:MAG: cytochrome P450 [Alphaproteobacteria bacterium]|nr:cytochrome P450 [Alphaproteobacteria bacterium]
MDERFDLNRPEVIQSPYPLFEKMRRDAPVHWNPSVKGWFLTRYFDVRMALRDPRFSVEKMSPFADRMGGTKQEKIAFLAEILGGWMVFKDPPEHTKLRQVLQGAFMPKPLAAMRPNVEAIAREILDGLGDRTDIDLIQDFGVPLPATVIGDLCGVPRDKTYKLRLWADDIAKFVLQGRSTPDKYDVSYKALKECVAFYRELVADHRANPKDDLISLMIDGGEVGKPMTDDEIVSTLVLILFAGHETTTNLIASGMFALLQNPDQMAKLEADRSLIPSAVEEFLRFEGPVSTLVRIALEDVEIGGQRIKKGDRVFASLYAAGHDPEIFEDAKDVDVTRRRNRHMAFGKGIHLCLGAPLARLEGQVAFEALLERYTDFKLRGDSLEWRDELITRGLHALPISMRPRF